MKTQIATLAALACTLTASGGDGTLNEDTRPGADLPAPVRFTDCGVPVYRAVDLLVRGDAETLLTGVTHHPDAGAPLPIDLGDCGECEPGFITDNISPFLGDGAISEPILDPDDPFFDPFFPDDPLCPGCNQFRDIFNDNYFGDVEPSELRRVPGPGIVCGYLSTYIRTVDNAPLREADSIRLNDADLLTQNFGAPAGEERSIVMRFTYAYDAILDIQPAIGQDGFGARFFFGGDTGIGGIGFPGNAPFGTCESFTFAIDFEGFLDPGQEVDYSLEFFADPIDPEPCSPDCTDVDGDGLVGLSDLLAVLSDFGQAAGTDGTVAGGTGLPTDIDCSGGNIGLNDLFFILTDFGTPAPQACQ